MLRNFFTIAYRNLIRNKGFSFINITGLAVGMASSILILLWIQNELSYDRFHEKGSRIYEAWNRSLFDNKLSCWSTTPKILARTLKQDLPEVETTARANWPFPMLISYGEKKLMPTGTIVDSGFLHIFTFPLLKGNPQTALNEMHSIVITESLSEKLFAKEDPMGKVVRLDNKENFKVTGVLKDLPNSTRFDFEFLLPWAYLRSLDGDDNYWQNNSTTTYVLLKQNAKLSSIEPKLNSIRKRYDKEDPNGQFFLYPISRWRLYSNFENAKESGGRIEIVRLFGIVAAFILLIACINFMNLSTARSEKRAREVGIRKVVGAQRKSLIGQFIGESVLLAFLAGIIAIVVVILVLPAYNSLTEKQLFIDYSNFYFWIAGISFILLTGIIAGSYPAFFLSSFQPVKVLKGTFKSDNPLITPRKILVILQFTFAIILIINTIIIRQQIRYAQERQTGYNKNSLAYHIMQGDDEKNYSLIKNELLLSGVATSVTKTSAPLTEGWSNTWGIQWPGKDPKDRTIIDRYCADESIAKTAGLQMVLGRDFNLKEYITDSTAILLNESAVKVMGLKDPIGQILKDNNKDWHVVGVFKDFILHSPYRPTVPMVIEGASGWFNVIHMKLNNKNKMSENLKKAEAIFKKYNPEYPFDYSFVDEQYERKFNDEKRIGTLAGLFAALSILISCLGLFGLATYMAQNRIKEIGVRKVLGASVAHITSLLSKDFLKLVIIAFLIASPIAWWAMDTWLKDFSYRVSINPWVFVLAGILSAAIALLTISFQAIRAAVANPVKSLRTE